MSLQLSLLSLLSAFLLFQVQPVISKFILPWFGGSPGVWTTCMLFFQIVLFAGYAYAHALTKLARRTQFIVHGVLVVAALICLPIAPGDAWKPVGNEDPVWRILLLLLGTVGLPYFVLSSTSPLTQVWFTRALPGQQPWRLYALSNFGSLAALLTLWRAGVPDVLGAVGLRPRAGAMAWPWALAWGVGAGLLAVLVAIAWLLVVDQVPVLKEAAERYAVQSGQPTGWWLVLAAVVLAPLVEEFIFRGLIFRGLRAAWPVWPAVVVSALVFAVVHDRPVGLPAIAAMGIAAALVAERSRWLLAPIACHATYNGVMVLVSWWVGKAE